MFQYTPNDGNTNWGAGAAAVAAAGAGMEARAFVPPASSHANVAPYTEDYVPTSPHLANDNNYYYAASSGGAGYSQQGDDFYDNRYQTSPNNGYYGYQDDAAACHNTTDYSDHGYYGDDYSDAALGAGTAAAGLAGNNPAGDGSAKLTDMGNKTYMHDGEHDPRQIFSKPDARE